MKRLPAKKAFVLFYAFDIVLLIAVALFLLPFSKNNNVQKSTEGTFLDPSVKKDITEIRILDKKSKCRISMFKIDDRWLGTDSFSNDSLYWPVDSKTVSRFLTEMSVKSTWKKKASNVTSWKNLGVDSANAVEVDFRIESKTAASLFFGYADDLNGEIYFRTSKDSTVWQTGTQAENFIYEKTPSFWADPYIKPLCLRSQSEDSEKGLRRGELAYIKPAEHIKPVKTVEILFDYGCSGVYSFYEKDDQIVVIPEFSGDAYLEHISYRYTISRWTYEKLLKELGEEN